MTPTDAELNEKVAAIAGWKWYTLLDDSGKGISCHQRLPSAITSQEIKNGWIREGKVDFVDQVYGRPSYATDLNAVVPVAEKEGSIEIQRMHRVKLGWQWEIKIWKDGGGFYPYGEAESDTLARAICLALCWQATNSP